MSGHWFRAVVLILIAFLLRGQETDLGELHRLTVILTGVKDTRPGDKQPLPAGAMEGLKCEEPSCWVTGLK